MADISALDFIEAEIEKRIKSFDQRRKFYRTGTYRFIIISALLSAFTTFLIGFAQIYNLTWPSVVALATSTSLTVLVAWNSFFNYRQRWVQNNDTLMNLYELRSDISYRKALVESLPESELDIFYDKYRNILREANSNWKEDRQSDSSSQ